MGMVGEERGREEEGEGMVGEARGREEGGKRGRVSRVIIITTVC